MIKIIELTAKRKTNSNVLVMWGSLPYSSSVSYNVYRQRNEGDEKTLIATTKIKSIIDSGGDIASNPNTIYTIQSDEDEQSVFVDGSGDNLLYCMAEDILWDLEYGGRGVVSKIYCKAEGNEKCPECYDSILKKIVKSSCSTCDGSGSINAFKGPVDSFVRILEKRKDVQLQINIENKTSYLSVMLGNIPLLKRGDVIILGNNGRYIVNSVPDLIEHVGLNDRKNFTISQTILLKQVYKPHYAFTLEGFNE